jgi:hypothetical protein
MKCHNCQQDIPEGFVSCPNCEKANEQAVIIASNDSPQEIAPLPSKLRKFSLYASLISLGLGILFGGFYLPAAAIVLGLLGVVLGIKDKKTTHKIYYVGIIIGSIGLIIGALTLYSSIINHQASQEADEHYSEELNIAIPNVEPDFYFIAFGLFAEIKDLPRKEFHYILSQTNSDALFLNVSSDNRWMPLPFSDVLLSFLQGFNLDLDYDGYYLLYDRINEQFGNIDDLNNYQNNYNFVLVIFDNQAHVLKIYDVYQS